MSEHRKLGKGLEALFGENVTAVLEEIQHNQASSSTKIQVKEIHPNPYQPRQVFDETKIDELAQSILAHGVFTPILLRKAVSGYQLIAGERRLRAAKKAGLESIPAIVLEFDDQQMMEISLIENIQREDLNVIEEARAYQTLITKLGLTQEEMALKIGKSRSHIANTLRLLQLPESVLHLVLEQKLTMGQVRPLIGQDERHNLEAIAQKIVAENLTARDVERMMKPKSTKPVKAVQDYRYAESLLRNKLQTKVKIQANTVHIHFDSDEDLNRLLEVLDVIEH